MRIEVWFDFVCPFCYLGKRNLDIALEAFSFTEYVTIDFKSYELNPDKKTYYAKLAEEAKPTSAIAKQAAEVRLTYNFDQVQLVNTFDAHRLIKYAYKDGKGQALVECLLRAYFTDGLDIGSHSTLIHLASEVNLDKEKVQAVLESCKYSASVREDEDLAKEIGIKSVPFFIINDKYGLSGVQSPQVLLEVIEEIWEESNQKVNVTKREQLKTSYCCGDECCEDKE